MFGRARRRNRTSLQKGEDELSARFAQKTLQRSAGNPHAFRRGRLIQLFEIREAQGFQLVRLQNDARGVLLRDEDASSEVHADSSRFARSRHAFASCPMRFLSA